MLVGVQCQCVRDHSLTVSTTDILHSISIFTYCCLGNHDRYHLEAQNEEERDIWIKCIGKSIGDAVYNGFKLKKRKLAQEGPRVY